MKTIERHNAPNPTIELYKGNLPDEPVRAYRSEKGHAFLDFVCERSTASALREYLRIEFPDHDIRG